MQWILLGSGCILPHAERGSACHLLLGDQDAALFDSGSGTKDRLARANVSLQQLSHLVYTHGHLDHWADLLSLLFLRANSPESMRRPGQTIVGPAGFPDMVRRASNVISSSLIDDNADLIWLEAEPGVELDAGWFKLAARSVSHCAMHAVGYRVQAEHGSIAYSGDSGPCDGLQELAQGVDCFVCECSLPESPKPGLHMTPGNVRALAEQTRPGLLVLTHLYPEVLEGGVIQAAFEGYEGRMVVGSDGLRIRMTGAGRAEVG